MNRFKEGDQIEVDFRNKQGMSRPGRTPEKSRIIRVEGEQDPRYVFTSDYGPLDVSEEELNTHQFHEGVDGDANSYYFDINKIKSLRLKYRQKALGKKGKLSHEQLREIALTHAVPRRYTDEEIENDSPGADDGLRSFHDAVFGKPVNRKRKVRSRDGRESEHDYVSYEGAKHPELARDMGGYNKVQEMIRKMRKGELIDEDDARVEGVLPGAEDCENERRKEGKALKGKGSPSVPVPEAMAAILRRARTKAIRGRGPDEVKRVIEGDEHTNTIGVAQRYPAQAGKIRRVARLLSSHQPEWFSVEDDNTTENANSDLDYWLPRLDEELEQQVADYALSARKRQQQERESRGEYKALSAFKKKAAREYKTVGNALERFCRDFNNVKLLKVFNTPSKINKVFKKYLEAGRKSLGVKASPFRNYGPDERKDAPYLHLSRYLLHRFPNNHNEVNEYLQSVPAHATHGQEETHANRIARWYNIQEND